MDPALYKAATQGDVETLRRLVVLDAGILSSTTPQLNTALHLAALHGHADFAREVLAVNAELLVARNADGDTPLHLAAKARKADVAELLVLHATALLKGTHNPLVITNCAGNTPLHEATRHRRIDAAFALLDAYPGCGYVLNDQNESPLDLAAREGLVPVVRRILDQAWVEAEYIPFNFTRGTALHQAVLGGHTRVVEILMETRPGLVDLTDSNGNNVLHYAAQQNKPRVVEMLLSKRTELSYKTNHARQSPLHVAAHYGSTEAIRVMLQHCPDVVEMADGHGRTAFHASVISGNTEALRCLLRNVLPGELLNRVDSDGNTALHLAARLLRVQCALLLLKDLRVNPCIANRDGHTARSLLESRGAGEMDAYEQYLWEQLQQQESIRGHRRWLPRINTIRRGSPNNERFVQDNIEVQLVIATLVATVTFAATFTMPGGYNQTEGTALHGHSAAFKIFVISNTFAMCASISVLLIFLWTLRDPTKSMVNQFVWALMLNFLACLAMLVALMAAVYVTMAPTVRWPAYIAMAIGASTPVFVFLVVTRKSLFYRQ